MALKKEDWLSNNEPAIEGKKGQYKIIRSRFLGRGGFGIVFVAIRKYKSGQQDKYEQVVIKEYKKSETWKTKDDWDKELVVLQRFQKEWDFDIILPVIDLFQAPPSKKQSSNKHYLVTKYAAHGSLYDIIKTPMKEEDILIFALRSAKILNYLHYEVLKNYQSKESGQQRKMIVGIIHRDFKPANLVYLQKDDQGSMFLIDFGIAKVGYADYPRSYSNCGTNNYKAPEINEQKQFNAKVDVYSFGCTLFEILSGGQKLIGNAGVDLRGEQRERYVKGKLMELQVRLRLQNSLIKHAFRWIEILHHCLAHNPKSRWSSRQLLQYLKKFDLAVPVLERWYFVDLSEKGREAIKKREQLWLSFEIFRVNMVQDILFGMFEFLYFRQPRLSKFLIYGIVRFIVIFILQKFNRAKDKAKFLNKEEKRKLVKRLIEDKKMFDLKDKSHAKIKDQVAKQRDSKGAAKSKGIAEDLTIRFPEILKENVSDARKVFYQFCFQMREQLLSSKDYQPFVKKVCCVILLMDDYDYYKEIQASDEELMENGVDVLALKKFYKLKQIVESRIESEGMENLFKACQVEMTVKSGLNKSQNKTEVPIEKR